ncbi:FtsX-like permease family protein [Roseivirga sp. E12]|uniref:FtsX-like permease family protein n=1 Tax=Roseivirga sp. E12 TaxID=2819237 RepID=UPI001ABC4286|nr:FtsX-like permease family protein [Roseivirga sp. E12]MBO3698563.1 ABC transporter permease [Roseivirga sp. E12]
MNLPYFISKRINATDKGSFSSIIHRVAIASVALGIAIMVISFQVLGGFQNNIKDKIFTFSGHIQIKKFSLNNSFEEEPIIVTDERMELLKNDPYVRHIQEFAHKPGLINRNGENFGLLFKGIGNSFDREAFQDYMVAGEIPVFDTTKLVTNTVMLSQRMADRMNVELGDRLVTVFIMDPPRRRSMVVSGIFNTGLDNFDEKTVIGDINMIRSLNDWTADQVGGYEVFVKDVDRLDEADDSIIQKISVEQYTEKVNEKFVQIFDWLGLLSQNVYILITLILFVACFNMISVLFILIMERTQMIGSFKAFGATNRLIRRIFAYNGVRLVIKGLLLGNVIAIAFGVLQYYFELIPLEPSTYYMDHVPIDWNWLSTIGINLLTLVIVALVLIIPTAVISRISPVKAIRFD